MSKLKDRGLSQCHNKTRTVDWCRKTKFDLSKIFLLNLCNHGFNPFSTSNSAVPVSIRLSETVCFLSRFIIITYEPCVSIVIKRITEFSPDSMEFTY